MPPKQRITREMILERSFAMFCKEGMEVINARSVAKALNCSTQPIFSYFEGMEDLKDALDRKAQETYREAIKESMGESLVACACAHVRFAIQQPKLFEHLFLRVDGERRNDDYATQGRQLVLETEAKASGLTLEQSEIVCKEVWIYAHGLAALHASRWIVFSEKEIGEMLAKAHDGALVKFGK